MNQQSLLEVYGKLDPFWETGTEGIIWSVYCPYLPGYDSLFCLKNGDQLTVYEDNQSVLWSGIIELEYERNYESFEQNPEYGQQTVNGYWVRGLQKNLDPTIWSDMFFQKKRGKLLRKKQENLHPFLVQPEKIEETLSTMPFKQGLDLYKSCLYGWLSFLSDGSHRSYADDWDFSLDEIVKLLGIIEPRLIEKWKTFPKYSYDSLIPANIHTFTRIALLQGIYGDLDFIFNSKEDRYKWLNDPKSIDNHTSPKDLLFDFDFRKFLTVRKVSHELSLVAKKYMN